MNCIFLAVLMIVVQQSKAHSCTPCAPCSNWTNSLERNPLIFWTIIPGTIHDGEFTQTNTESESHKLIESLARKTLNENTVTVDSKVSASGVMKAFDLSAEISTGYKHFTSTSTEALTSEERNMANQMTATYRVPAGEVFASIAEMKMFAYKSAEGNKHRLVLPTGQLYIGTTNKEKLKNQIMDDTFTGLARRWGLTTRSRQQLHDSIGSKLPTVTKEFLRPDTYYRIFNTVFPGLRLAQPTESHVGCVTGWDGAEDQLWRFEKTDMNTYMIYNKKFKHHRLVSYPLSKELPRVLLTGFSGHLTNIGLLRTYSGKIYDDQKFKIKVVGVNKVRIEDGTGRALMNCQFSQPGESDDEKIWELRA